MIIFSASQNETGEQTLISVPFFSDRFIYWNCFGLCFQFCIWRDVNIQSETNYWLIDNSLQVKQSSVLAAALAVRHFPQMSSVSWASMLRTTGCFSKYSWQTHTWCHKIVAVVCYIHDVVQREALTFHVFTCSLPHLGISELLSAGLVSDAATGTCFTPAS